MDKKIAAATTLGVAVTAAAGSRASRRRSASWYSHLRKPAYVPPSIVFPIAWTTLYADIALASAAGAERCRTRGDTATLRALAAALGVNLALNAGWSWVFFRYHRLALSAVWAGVLAASSADLTRRLGAADPRAGAALVPYPLWCAFATVMSTHIWRLNR